MEHLKYDSNGMFSIPLLSFEGIENLKDDIVTVTIQGPPRSRVMVPNAKLYTCL